MNQTLHFLTYNMQTDRSGPPFAFFDGRCHFVREQLPGLGAEVIAFQEVTDRQKAFLEESFPDYQFLGSGREQDCAGERMTVGFRRDYCEALRLDTFWLSDTPHLPGSRFHTDQGSHPRICTAVELARLSDRRRFRVYNTHLCNVGETARIQGASVVLQRIAADYAADPLPVILCGDFNEEPMGPAVASVRRFRGAGDYFRDVSAPVGITYHAYHPENPDTARKIDYIFTNIPCYDAKAQAVTAHRDDGMYLSDHYPVAATFDF